MFFSKTDVLCSHGHNCPQVNKFCPLFALLPPWSHVAPLPLSCITLELPLMPINYMLFYYPVCLCLYSQHIEVGCHTVVLVFQE